MVSHMAFKVSEIVDKHKNCKRFNVFKKLVVIAEAPTMKKTGILTQSHISVIKKTQNQHNF